MLRILMVTRGVAPLAAGAGGAELVASQLAREMALDGHEVVVVSDVGHPAPEPVAGLSYRPLGNRLLRLVKRRLPAGFPRWLAEHLIGNVSAARAARKLLAQERFDLVHVHGALAALLISRGARVPVVYTEHDATPWICRYRHWWERAIRKVVYRTVNLAAARRATHVATVFHTLGAALVERHGIDGSKVTTIMNGTDVDVFNPHRPGLNPVREACGFERYILFVGRLTPRKAPDLLVRAVADTPGVNLVLAGDGELRPRLEDLARELGVD